MTIGEKIKYYRTNLGLTQQQFSEMSGISISTVKKLEADLMHPKYQQLQRVADALGVSINIFLDFDIETVSDVLSLIIKMDEQVDVYFDADLDENGKPVPESIRISFGHQAINRKLSDYIRIRTAQNEMNNSRNTSAENDIEKKTYEKINSDYEQMRLSICDDATMVGKEFRGKHVVKIYP